MKPKHCCQGVFDSGALKLTKTFNLSSHTQVYSKHNIEQLNMLPMYVVHLNYDMELFELKHDQK